MAAFLDVSSAYDNVLYTKMIDKLIEEECPYRILKYVEEWMSGRMVKFVIDNNTTEERYTYKGLPQGGVLSPILYDIYTNKITENIHPEVNQIQFADDIAIYSTNENYNEKETRIKITVETLKSNLDSIGLELQPKKQ